MSQEINSTQLDADELQRTRSQFRDLDKDLRKVLTLREYEYFFELVSLLGVCKKIAEETVGVQLPKTLTGHLDRMRGSIAIAETLNKP